MDRYNLYKAHRSTYRAVANHFLYEEWQKEYLTFATFEGPCHGSLDHWFFLKGTHDHDREFIPKF